MFADGLTRPTQAARRNAHVGAAPGAEERGNHVLRFFDRYAGIPLLCALSLFRRHRDQPAPETVQRIGLMLFGVIGDSLLASATIPDLRRRFPSARIVGFVTNATRSVGTIIEGVDEWIVLPIRRPVEAIAVLRADPVDILIDFAQWVRITAVLSASARARFVVGFATAGQWRHYAYDATAVHSDRRHELENFRALVATLGVVSAAAPRLRRGTAFFDLPTEMDHIVLHPWPAGYRSMFREWPEERWIAVSRAVKGWGYGIVITGGPGDRDRARKLADAIGPGGGDVLCVAGKTSLAETVSLLERAAAVVSVNTGLMHIAAALDRPMVALHGPTNPRRWGPVSNKAIVVGPGPERGCGYLNLGHEYPAHPPDCMGCITVDEVLAALAACLPERREQRPNRRSLKQANVDSVEEVSKGSAESPAFQPAGEIIGR